MSLAPGRGSASGSAAGIELRGLVKSFRRGAGPVEAVGGVDVAIGA
jgi:hypothetical protein